MGEFALEESSRSYGYLYGGFGGTSDKSGIAARFNEFLIRKAFPQRENKRHRRKHLQRIKKCATHASPDRKNRLCRFQTTCRNSCRTMRPHRLVWSRTTAFHAVNRGSNPLGDAKEYHGRTRLAYGLFLFTCQPQVSYFRDQIPTASSKAASRASTAPVAFFTRRMYRWVVAIDLCLNRCFVPSLFAQFSGTALDRVVTKFWPTMQYT